MVKMVILAVYTAALICEVVTFHQSDYKIKYERVEVVSFDKHYIQNLKTNNFKYNRTFTATNVTQTYLVDFGNDMEVEVQAYKFASNEYRLFPITFGFNYCAALARNEYGLRNLYKCGNYTKCPMIKGRYLSCYFSPDESRFPPYIPEGSYRIDMKFFYLSKEVEYLQFFGTVSRPLKMPFA